MKPVLERARLRHAVDLSQNLRQADIQEVLSASGRGGFQALVAGLTGSDEAWAVVDRDSGKTILMFGVGPTESPRKGSPWMLASDAIEERPMTILRGSRQALRSLHKRYPILANSVDARNEVHIRWLKWLGFRFYGEHRGVDGALFRNFIRLRDHV